MELKYLDGAFEDLSPGECYELEAMGKGKICKVIVGCGLVVILCFLHSPTDFE